MKPTLAILAHILCIFTSVNAEANTSEQMQCKQFNIVFTSRTKDLPLAVFSNEEKIGRVELLQELADNSQAITVCIENKYSGLFEKNTICYASIDKIVVYNVWSTGVDLKEGESVKGFSSRLALFCYEAQELLALIRDAAMAFAGDIARRILGEISV